MVARTLGESILRKLFFVLILLPLVAYSTEKLPTPGDTSQIRHSTDLMDAYNDAVTNDPIFQRQLANYLSSKEAIPQARALLLPQINATGALSETYQNSNLLNSVTFNSDNYTVNVSQAIFNFRQFKELSRAKATVKAAAYQLSSQQQDLIVRLATAYFNVLEARDIVFYAKRQVDFLRRAYVATRERYKLKHATKIDLNLSKGSYESIRAQYRNAKITLYNRIQELSQVTGKQYLRLANLAGHFPQITPNPLQLGVWIAKATTSNLALLAAQMQYAAARKQIQAARGDYLPTINATANWDEFNGISNGIFEERLKTGTYGLEANWNLLEGGLTNSLVRQAQADYQASYASVRENYLNALASVKIAYAGATAGLKRAFYSKLSMNAYLKAAEGGDEAYQSGVFNIFDLLQTQTRLFAAEQQYASNLYLYLISILELERAAGTLSVNSLVQINSWLKPAKQSFNLAFLLN